MFDRRGQSVEPPLYCPACRRPDDLDDRLCSKCGEALRPQGFCPICEEWVRAGPGSLCPKHEVELTERPPISDFDPSSTPMVTVATFGMTAEARGPQLRLEAEGIPVFLDGERMGEHVIYQVATGGVKLQVPAEFVAEARVLLAQSWAPVEKDHDPDDPWEGLAPEPADRRKSVMKSMILVILFGPIVVSIITMLLMSLGR
jgi:hypothetical protein